MIISILSCNRINNADYGTLNFSSDTVFFDTIFTYVGSTTKILQVYNKSNKPVKIDKIYVANSNTKFRMNIDGQPGNYADDIVIDANDSMFIFVEVTIDPTKDDLIEADSLIFISGSNQQQVLLYAVGMDVHLFNGERLQTQTWVNDKPYLIYNSVLVDTDQVLTIDPGVQIYSHRNSFIIVSGTLVCNGDKDNPISMRGDRIDDEYYLDKPGQWGGIYFLPGSHDNFINYTKITEGFYGIGVDSSINLNYPTLFLNNSTIAHCSYMGLMGKNTSITALNSVIADCGVHNVGLLFSGVYSFYHCTIQNNYTASVRNSPAVGIMNYTKDENNNLHYEGFISAYFANSIIYGNQKTEFIVSAYDTTNSLAFTVQNCLLKLDLQYTDTSLAMYQNVLVNQDPQYVDIDTFDYHLSENSPCIDKANFEIDNNNATYLQFDMDGIDRLINSKPDIGAFEFVK